MNYKFLTVTVLATTMGLFTSCEKDNDDNLFENIDELYVSATREANASRITISDLEAELASSQSEANGLTIDLASALSEVASLTASIAGLEGDNAALVADLANAKASISALQTQEAVLMDTIDSLMDALQAAKAASEVDADTIVALNADLVAAIASQNVLQNALNDANETIAALRAQISDAAIAQARIANFNQALQIDDNGNTYVQSGEGIPLYNGYSVNITVEPLRNPITFNGVTYTYNLAGNNGYSSQVIANGPGSLFESEEDAMDALFQALLASGSLD